MSDELKVQVTLTAPVRVSFPQVFEPRAVVVAGVSMGEPFYSARLVFPVDHPDIQGIRVAGSKLLGLLKPGIDIKTLKPYEDFFWPFKSGAMMIAEGKARAARKGVEYRGYEDYMDGCQTLLVKSNAKNPPQLAVFANGKWVTLSAETKHLHKDKFYNGMLAIAEFTLVGIKLPTRGWGVTAYLNCLGAEQGGDHLGQRTEVTFGGYIPTVTTDEIPFH